LKNQSPVLFAVLLACVGAAQAQSSSVTIFGVMDASLRSSNGQGATGKDRANMVLSGGLAPSRWGIRVVEDLGDGLKALAYLDSRFQLDTGTLDAGATWQQSWVGIESPKFGRLTAGRDYNVLFDITATTFAAFLPVGPFINSYKPEVALALGSRNDNQLKYRIGGTQWVGALQVSAPEGGTFSPTFGKSYGGTFKYNFGPVSAGVGFLEREDNASRKARAYLAGAAYRQGDLYLNAVWAQNRFDDGLNAALMLVGSGAENTVVGSQAGQLSTRVNRRDLITFGGTYGLTPFWTVGAQYWNLKQSFHTPGAPDGKGDFMAALVDYRLSKRTDLYGAIEYTTLDAMQLTDTTTGTPNGATNRTAFMAGIRHVF